MLEELLQRLMGNPPTTIRDRDELDEKIEPDAVLSLRARFRDESTGHDVVTAESLAEVRRLPTFGFNPKRERIQVRFRLPAGSPGLPLSGITLQESEEVFGPPGSWKCVAVMLPGEDGTADYLLED